MTVKFLSGAAIERTIAAFVDEYDELHWAVAWATLTPLAESVLARLGKRSNIVVGLAFSQTDPDLVEAMVGVRGCRVVKRFPNGTFHPKVYAFRTGDTVAAIVGSANFTRGGLGKNREAAVLLTGKASDQALADVLAFVGECAHEGEPVTQELADWYRLSCKIAARLPKPPRDPLQKTDGAAFKGLTSSCVTMTWADYISAVRSSRVHELDERLLLLKTIQTWLASADSFKDLSTVRRKAVGGFLGQTDRMTASDLNQGWEAFGSMKGAGDFMNRVDENDRHLAHAVDAIPQKGDVTRTDYDRFVGLFAKAFKNSSRQGGVATATRLLAMKRPDVFLCISKPNLLEASNAMGFARSTLNLNNYWDRVVEVIRASDWYNVDKPKGEEGRIWEGRAAMLDSIYYRPE